MEDAILKAALNFGVFPTVTIYLIIVIIKDFKADIEKIKSMTEDQEQQMINQYNDIHNSLEQLVKVNEQMQTILNICINKLLLKNNDKEE